MYVRIKDIKKKDEAQKYMPVFTSVFTSICLYLRIRLYLRLYVCIYVSYFKFFTKELLKIMSTLGLRNFPNYDNCLVLN